MPAAEAEKAELRSTLNARIAALEEEIQLLKDELAREKAVAVRARRPAAPSPSPSRRAASCPLRLCTAMPRGAAARLLLLLLRV